MTQQPTVPDIDGDLPGEVNLPGETNYRLRLFVAGASPNSTRAIVNLKQICETYLKENYEIEIVDVHQQPLMAQSEQIIALPLLVKLEPGPVRRLIGDMSDTKKVLRGLDLAEQ